MGNENKENFIELALEHVGNMSNDPSRELFSVADGELDLKNDFIHPEELLFPSLNFADSFLVDCGLPPIYSDFLTDVKFHHISINRKSREEFVATNTRNLNNIQVPAEFDKIEESRK